MLQKNFYCYHAQLGKPLSIVSSERLQVYESLFLQVSEKFAVDWWWWVRPVLGFGKIVGLKPIGPPKNVYVKNILGSKISLSTTQLWAPQNQNNLEVVLK